MIAFQVVMVVCLLVGGVAHSEVPQIGRCINKWESGNDWKNRNHPYYGAAQWIQTTWDSAGGEPYDGVRPDRAPQKEQIKRTLRLIEVRRKKGLDPLGKWGYAARRNCRRYL